MNYIICNFEIMKLFILNLLITSNIFNFVIDKTESDYHSIPPILKTVIFKNNSHQTNLPILTDNENLELSFDDLSGYENDYYYKISYHNWDWSESNLFKNEYSILLFSGDCTLRLKGSPISIIHFVSNSLTIIEAQTCEVKGRLTDITKSKSFEIFVLFL